MSTLKVNNLQVGQDSTPTNNLTWFQPGTPDGSIRLGSGNAGSATTKFTFDKDGNLTCVGTITARSIEGTIDDWITHLGDTDTKYGFPAADTFSVETAGDERFRITSAGRVGVGTDNVLSRLHVADTNTTVWPFTSAVADTYAYTPYPHELIIDNDEKGTEGSFAGIYFNAGADTDGSKVSTARIAAIDTGSYKADLVFSNRGAGGSNHKENLRITSDGKVGINTTAPDAMLQVDYDFANSKVGLRLRAASGSGTKTWQLSEINGTPAVLTIRNATNGYNILNIDGANQRVGINKTDPDGKGIDVAHGRTNTYSGTQDHRGLAHIIARNTSDAPDRFASISIVSGGSTQAEGSINLVQTANYTGDLTFKLRYGATSWAERLRIKSDGKVGIGITPTAKLHVNGVSSSDIITARSADNNGNCILNLLSEGTTGASRINFSDTAGIDGWITYYHSDRSIVFATAGTGNERVRIGGSNNIFRAQTVSYPETTETLAEFNGGVADGNRFTNRYIKIKNTYTGSTQGGIPIVWEANANGSNDKSYGAIVTDANGDVRILNKAAGSAVAVGSGLGLSNRLQIYVAGNIRMGTSGTGYGGLSVQNSPSVNQPAIEAGSNTATNGVFAFATRYVGANEDYYSTCISTNYSSGRSVFAHGARGSRNDADEYGDFLAGNATSTSSTAFVSTFDNFQMNRKALTMNNTHMTLWRQSQGNGTGEADSTCTKGLEVKMIPGLTLTEDGNVGVGDQCEGTLDNVFHIRQSGDVTATLGSCPAGLVIEATTDANWADGEAGAELCFMKGNDITGAIRAEHDRTGGDHSFEDGGLAFYTAPAAETPTATRKFRIKSTGNATLTGTLTDGSDVRLKTDVVGITSALSKVNQMRGVEYKLSSAALDNCGMRDREDGLKNLGVIADEIESILPQVVESDAIKGLDGTDYKGVSYSRIVPLLIEAIKELSAKVTALESS